jgi:hypothetical protein
MFYYIRVLQITKFRRANLAILPGALNCSLPEFARKEGWFFLQDKPKYPIQAGPYQCASIYAAGLCTSWTISEILGAQRAQNAGQDNLTDP